MIMKSPLQRLTGGTVLSRDKDFIVFYRGKDFLPSAVSDAIEKRRKNEIFGEKQEVSSNGLEVNAEVKPSVDTIPLVKPSAIEFSLVDEDGMKAKLAIEKRRDYEVFSDKLEISSHRLEVNTTVKTSIDSLTFHKFGDICSASANVDRLEAKLASVSSLNFTSFHT